MSAHNATLHVTGWTHGAGTSPAHSALDPTRADALREQLRIDGVPAMVLATCHRFEVYWTGADRDESRVFHAIQHTIGHVHDSAPSQLAGDDAVAHAMAVASGLRSLRRGEPEILGQIRTAWRLAQSAGASSPTLDDAVRHVVSAARHIRRHLGDDAQESIGAATVRLLAAEFERARDHATNHVLIIGAGIVGESVAAALHHARRTQLLPSLRHVHITNRTDERASALAQRTESRVVSWDGWTALLPQADVVIATARSAQPLITRELSATTMAARTARATWIDLASPPNIAPDAAIGACVRRSLHDLPSQAVQGPDLAQAALQRELERYAIERRRRQQFASRASFGPMESSRVAAAAVA